MASGQFKALTDLKSAFGKLGDDSSALLDAMRVKVDEINKFNKDSAGTDDIGKQYHQTVDQPTKDLTDLLGQVRDAFDNAGKNGQDASDLFNSTDQDLTNHVNGS
ncbi:hypothetical protein [Kitasatospora kifunensis]|uniref:Uncharacterized protein n=1 Tax=Kitasatospora kifunensis TaxID=58351 RepID=A0A7W7VXK0_KITKI|nr:hypothetical protein [Kitasatospora kifunensis]MBB4926038.1 hypothetical protein [Kitasatospora kifunensis]